MKAVNPYLNFNGTTEEAFNFYKSVFGGKFLNVVRFKDMPMQGTSVSEADGDKIMHISLPIGGGTTLMGTDACESMGHKLTMGNNSYIFLDAESKTEADKLFESLSKDGDVEMAIGDSPWGSYFGSFKDRFGVLWMVEYNAR